MLREEAALNLDPRDPELLPPRELMTILPTDPGAYGSVLGQAGVPGLVGTTDGGGSTPGPGAPAGETAGSTQDLADGEASSNEGGTASDQPQTVTSEDSRSASAES